MIRTLSTLAAILTFAALAPAQAGCTGAPPGGTAFLADCPCGPAADPQLYFQGTSRIGSIQRFAPSSIAWSIPPAFLVIGLAPAAPTPIPMGLVVCGTWSSLPMTPIQNVAIDPLVIAPITFRQNGIDPPNWNPLPYYFFVPYAPLAVGATMHAQYFQQELGTGSVPFAASHTIGFTIQP